MSGEKPARDVWLQTIGAKKYARHTTEYENNTPEEIRGFMCIWGGD